MNNRNLSPQSWEGHKSKIKVAWQVQLGSSEVEFIACLPPNFW